MFFTVLACACWAKHVGAVILRPFRIQTLRLGTKLDIGYENRFDIIVIAARRRTPLIKWHTNSVWVLASQTNTNKIEAFKCKFLTFYDWKYCSKKKNVLPQEVAIVEPILRVLQLLCENHNSLLQVGHDLVTLLTLNLGVYKVGALVGLMFNPYGGYCSCCARSTTACYRLMKRSRFFSYT